MRSTRTCLLALVTLSVLTAISCRPELVVRLATRAYRDGSMDRSVEVVGRNSDRESPTEDDWLQDKIGIRLAVPDAWKRVESGPGWVKAEGFFLGDDELPPILAFDKSAAGRHGRTRTIFEVEDRVVLKRWTYVERHGDPFSPADSAAALDALAELAVEALRQEVHTHFGSEVDTGAAERFLRHEGRALSAALLTSDRSSSAGRHDDERTERWSSVLSQHGVPIAGVGSDDYWEVQTPALLEWARDRVAERLSTAERPIDPGELSFWPVGQDFQEQANEIIERVWGSEDELLELIEPHMAALEGYYGAGDAPWFRFEVRLQLPGTLLSTNGTPDGESIIWLFRERDMTFGEINLRAESLELQTEALISLGARRDFTKQQLVRLADLLFKRDPGGDLLAVLESAEEQASLDPLLDEDALPDELEFVAAELFEILDPQTP
jgi:hypothetical protein